MTVIHDDELIQSVMRTGQRLYDVLGGTSGPMISLCPETGMPSATVWFVNDDGVEMLAKVSVYE